MKRMLLFAIILYVSKFASAQNFLVSDSSRWYHSMSYGSFHSYVTGDTIIQNKAAKVIRQEALVKQPEFGQGLRVYDLPLLYIHTTADTTFVFNPLFNRFTPLYVFNVNEGDSVCLPLLHAGGGAFYTGSTGDSMFCFVIDSIRIKTYDTSNLKTFFTRSFTRNNQIKLNWGADTIGAYAEKIGAVYGGLVPSCVGTNCAVVLSDNYQGAGALRCYSDENYSIKLVAGSCNNGGISVAVEDVANAKNITVVPNPANDKLYVNLKDNAWLQQADIFNSVGQRVLSVRGNISQIDVSQLSAGIYFIKLGLHDNSFFIQRLLIEH